MADVGEQALLRLRLSRSQSTLLVVLLALLCLIATLVVTSGRAIGEQTETLNYQLQHVSSDRHTLERQVGAFALYTERLADGQADDERFDVSVGLVERHILVSRDEAEVDARVGLLLDDIESAVVEVQEIRARGELGNEQTAVALDRMTDASKRLVDLTERQNVAELHALERAVSIARLREWVVAGMFLLLVALLVVSLQRMARRNYRAAAKLLLEQDALNEKARAAEARAQQLSTTQTNILEKIATGTDLSVVLRSIESLIGSQLSSGELRFRVASDPRDPAAAVTVDLPATTAGDDTSPGALDWIPTGGTAPDDLHDVLTLAARLGSMAIDRQIAADAMAHQATHDALTGLPNRKVLVNHLADALEKARRTDSDLTVMFLDLDRFKAINDSLGHGAGDALLVEVARRLEATARRLDLVARFGGDEFVLVMENLGQEGAEAVAARILEALEPPTVFEGNVLHISASIGVVTSDGDHEIDQILRDADVAMYQAKRSGARRYSVFDSDMRAWADRRQATEADLQSALANDEIVPWFQPVFDLQSGALGGFEALARWNRPGSGLVEPGAFIAVAEQIGLIPEVDRRIRDLALGHLREWRRHTPGLTMSVNVSVHGLTQADFVDSVAELLEATGVDPAALILEMTETVLLEDAQPVRQRLEELRNLGLRLAIDDFGTGYSSLQDLRDMKVDILKIDRAFVNGGKGATEGVSDPPIVASVTDLAQSLGLQVVAEGIETEEQQRALRQLGIEYGQGFLFGRPMAPADVPGFLAPLASAAVRDPD